MGLLFGPIYMIYHMNGRMPEKAAPWEERNFFTRRVKEGRQTIPGTFGSVPYSHFLTAWPPEDMDWENAFQDAADRRAEEKKADGAAVGMMPNNIVRLVKRMKAAVKRILRQEVDVVLSTIYSILTFNDVSIYDVFSHPPNG